jgi:predicted small integral membrane protein
LQWFRVGFLFARDYDWEKLNSGRGSCSLQKLNRRGATMVTRWAKLALLGGIGLYYALVVLGNLTDFGTNYEFVRHVLLMDSTIPGNHEMWRAVRSPGLHLAFYWSIIAWETATTVLLWWGWIALIRAAQAPADVFP